MRPEWGCQGNGGCLSFEWAQIMISNWKLSSPRRWVASCLCVSMVCLSCAVPRPAAALPAGARTPGEAVQAAKAPSAFTTLASWRPTSEFLASAADTSAVDFPGDAQPEGTHLYRDVGIFVIVSAFVGYFIVKVFLEKDKQETPAPKTGKQIPGSLTTVDLPGAFVKRF